MKNATTSVSVPPTNIPVKKKARKMTRTIAERGLGSSLVRSSLILCSLCSLTFVSSVINLIEGVDNDTRVALGKAVGRIEVGRQTFKLRWGFLLIEDSSLLCNPVFITLGRKDGKSRIAEHRSLDNDIVE